jgi:hypothetical protein
MNLPSGKTRCSAILVRAMVLPMLALTLTGCVSSKYKSASKETPPPVLLNLAATQPPVEAVVHSVIVYKGPGSWKKEAYWDEYVVSVANRGGAPLVVETASLTDFRGDATGPGDKPWLLEEESRTRRENLNRAAKTTLVQMGSGLAAISFGGGVLAASAGVGGMAVGIGGLAILPFYVGGAIYRNVSSRRDIEVEFARRRLILPLPVAPGQTVQGSLFFRISPGPQRLVLRARTDGDPFEIAIDLAPLKGLHLKPNAPTADNQARP